MDSFIQKMKWIYHKQINKRLVPSDDETLAAFEDQIEKAINLKVLKGYGTMYKVAMAKAKKSSPAIYQHVKTLYEKN